ncbi:MAG: RluA family pseudouridine synthase [Ruminococcaceae bacterium]|nr:RluA family pseudouridine synthase [Oscillospiraceae bacterium]
MIDILYCDEKLVVCIKPPRILSTDEPGGLPELLRNQMGTDNFRTVHRLDRVVGGLMVLARTSRAASDLSKQVMDSSFGKHYLAIIHGHPRDDCGTFTDLLIRDKAQRKTYVTQTPGKDAQEASLNYRVLGCKDGVSLVSIDLITGRTHQIRAQFSSRGMPLLGDKKYGIPDSAEDIALWSSRICFSHPKTGQPMEFTASPPMTYPWSEFEIF